MKTAKGPPFIEIKGRKIGPGHPVYLVAEMSANHNQNFEQAKEIIRAAKEAGADAVKLQTYTPDTLTIQSDKEDFKIKGGTLWDGKTLHDLYGEAFTPWEWQPKLARYAEEIGIDCFSTAFDATAIDFLEAMNVPVHKVASFEIVDIPLIRKMARTGKPLIISTGMATLEEIGDAVTAAREGGVTQIALLKCTSSYPATPESMNLNCIPDLAKTFQAAVGLSDHTMGTTVPVAAVALGACLIEKHFTLSRNIPGPDSSFSLEPKEFRDLADAVRAVEKAFGNVRYGPTEWEIKSRVFRRSLYAVKDIKSGEKFTEENVRSIRPGQGLPPKHWHEIVGCHAARDIERGTALEWSLIDRSRKS